MEGMLMRLEKDGKVVREYRYPTSIRMDWDSVETALAEK